MADDETPNTFSEETWASYESQLPITDNVSAAAIAQDLSREMKSSVKRYRSPTEKTREATQTMTQNILQSHNVTISRPETVLVVDRNPRIQTLTVMMAMPNNEPWIEIGQVPVSTGQQGRKNHYITPVGIFMNEPSRLGYRALGTYNENHIRGIGLKGMRVWDFGWQEAEKGWKGNGSSGSIRLEMHATDPANLESRLGRTNSAGCIRIPTDFDRFLDHTGLIDGSYEIEAQTDQRFASLLPKNRHPYPTASNLTIVVDSAEKDNRQS